MLYGGSICKHTYHKQFISNMLVNIMEAYMKKKYIIQFEIVLHITKVRMIPSSMTASRRTRLGDNLSTFNR